MSGISRRKVLIGAGALAATAAAAPILAACQPSKTAGSGKVVVMTDPNEFNDDDRKTLETATKLKIEVVATDLTYDELRDLAKKVNKKDAGKRVYWGFVHSNNDQWIDRTAMNMLAEKNQSLYTDDFSKIAISSNPEATKVIRYLYDLAADGV